jgi:signal transduction histidine kinase
MSHQSCIRAYFLWLLAMTSVIGPGESRYDCGHWRAERPRGILLKTRASQEGERADLMKFKHNMLIIQTQSIPLPGWFLRWAPWVSPGFACVGYLSGVLTTQHLTLLSLLLLTGTYGAWLMIYQIGQWRFEVRTHPGFVLALFCLACASQFIPLPATNVYWLPLLSVITAGLMTTITPRTLSLLAAGALCLSSYLAVCRITPGWDVSGQVLLLLSFFITYGYLTIFRELALAHKALENSNARLAEVHTRLREYSTQVEELSVMRERNRIAREIHDTLGHSLTLLSVQLETATQLEARGDPRLHEELRQARQVAKACLTDVRHSVNALRPDDSSAGTFEAQLRKLVAICEAASPEARITLDLEEATHPLPPDLCQTLYRCVQEALTNIRKHAHATKVLLRLSTSEERVELTVLDNGEGGESLHVPRTPGFGLRGMRERVSLLDGWLRAGPEPGHGWRVEVMLPLTSRRQAEGGETRIHKTREKV